MFYVQTVDPPASECSPLLLVVCIGLHDFTMVFFHCQACGNNVQDGISKNRNSAISSKAAASFHYPQKSFQKPKKTQDSKADIDVECNTKNCLFAKFLLVWLTRVTRKCWWSSERSLKIKKYILKSKKTNFQRLKIAKICEIENIGGLVLTSRLVESTRH